MNDGMIDGRPGAILALWQRLRERVGNVAAKSKPGVRFKVRSAEDLIDKVADAANDLGILIYPSWAAGKGQVIDAPDDKVGTLAEVQLTVTAQAVSDGSMLTFGGFGLGADTQDKAGGKAGTYAFKQALIQALLAGGSRAPRGFKVPDTDDSDTPVEGGVRRHRPKPTADQVAHAMTSCADGDTAAYRAAVELLKALRPEDQVGLKDLVYATRARCVPGGEPAPK